MFRLSQKASLRLYDILFPTFKEAYEFFLLNLFIIPLLFFFSGKLHLVQPNQPFNSDTHSLALIARIFFHFNFFLSYIFNLHNMDIVMVEEPLTFLS